MQSFRQKRQIVSRSARIADEPPVKDKSAGESGHERQDEYTTNSRLEAAWGDSDSELSPKNWPLVKKLGATALVTAISSTVQYASAVDSAAAEKIAAEFGVSIVTESLATGLFLVGFAIGAPVAGPLSEIAGRNPVYVISLIAFMLSTVGAALAPNIGAQLAFRFLAGTFGSTPLVCAGGTVSDLWNPFEQVWVFPFYATGGFLGLAVGPAVGGLIAESRLVGWRWVEWSTLVMSGTVLVLVLLLQPETFAPVLLQWKADARSRTELRTTAGNAEHGQRRAALRGLGVRLGRAFYRPIELSIHEPIILVISLYLSVLYVVIFTFLPGYTFIFTDTYGFGPALRGLSFLGMGVGFLLAWATTVPVTIISHRVVQLRGELCPESRLYYALCGAPAIPVSLFWMGWTTRESISPWSALGASTLLGFGVLCVFFSSYQYIIHTYTQYAASGLVFVTLTRYLVAGGMNTVGIPMYHNLGVAHTLTILGAFSVVLLPIPYCLFWFGPAIRKWSQHSTCQ